MQARSTTQLQGRVESFFFSFFVRANWSVFFVNRSFDRDGSFKSRILELLEPLRGLRKRLTTSSRRMVARLASFLSPGNYLFPENYMCGAIFSNIKDEPHLHIIQSLPSLQFILLEVAVTLLELLKLGKKKEESDRPVKAPGSNHIFDDCSVHVPGAARDKSYEIAHSLGEKVYHYYDQREKGLISKKRGQSVSAGADNNTDRKLQSPSKKKEARKGGASSDGGLPSAYVTEAEVKRQKARKTDESLLAAAGASNIDDAEHQSGSKEEMKGEASSVSASCHGTGDNEEVEGGKDVKNEELPLRTTAAPGAPDHGSGSSDVSNDKKPSKSAKSAKSARGKENPDSSHQALNSSSEKKAAGQSPRTSFISQSETRKMAPSSVLRVHQDLLVWPHGLSEIPFKELEEATNGFNSSPVTEGGCFLGSGSFGDVYLGHLQRGNKPFLVAVKKLKPVLNKTDESNIYSFSHFLF